MDHSYDYISFFMPFVDIPVSLDNLFQRIAPIMTDFIFPVSISSLMQREF